MKKTPTTNGAEQKAHMHAGMLCSQHGYTLAMSRAAQKRFGFKVDDYLYVSSLERDTRICRQLKDFPIGARTSSDYVYLDRNSLGLLDVDIHDCLYVWKTDLTLEIP
jgi:hypothetical protein